MISIKKLLTKILSMIGGSSMGTTATTLTGAINEIKTEARPISTGGTGLTASPSMLTNLGSTTAADVLQASPRPGVTGTLPIANGGTGETQVRATTSTDVVTASSGWSVSSVQYTWWGKVATMKITFKKNSTAITTATTVTFGTLAEGYRPRYNSPGMIGWGGNVIVESGGAIKNNGTFNANTEYTVYSTFVLGNTSM